MATTKTGVTTWRLLRRMKTWRRNKTIKFDDKEEEEEGEESEADTSYDPPLGTTLFERGALGVNNVVRTCVSKRFEFFFP